MSSTASVLLAVLLLEIGSGLQGLLLPVQAQLAGYSPAGIGLLGGGYYLGFVAGCLAYPRTVRRVGHVRSYAAVAVIGTVAILAHPLTPPSLWLGLRFLLGYSFAGLFMVIESWLNGAVHSGFRGRTLSLYMAATWIGLIGGKMLFPVTPYQGFQPFTLAAVAVALSVLPIALTRGVPPAIPGRATAPTELIRVAPLGVVGCVGTGLANGAFWTFGPLYAVANDPDPLKVSLFISACVAGGALAQWPAGRLSDAFDRRWTLIGLCTAAGAAGLLLAFGGLALMPAGLLFGAAALPAYSVFVAYANDRAEVGQYVDMSSLLLMAFGLGALVGPPLAGLVTGQFGPASVFFYTAAVHGTLVLICLAGVLRDAAIPPETRAAFAALPPIGHGTQALANLQADVAAEGVATPGGSDQKGGPAT